jgi:phospholipid transport system substrate-binding protein
MSLLRTLLVALVMLPVLVGGMPARAAGDPNLAVVEKFHAALLDTLKQGKVLGIQGRYKKLEPEVDAAFDLKAMTQFTVGPKWAGMSEPDRASVVAAFRRMTISSYASNFKEFKDQQFTLDQKVDVRGVDRIVKSQIIPKGEKPVNLRYRLREAGGAVRVIDVIYESVSQLATRRSDFAATVNEGGAPALVKKLDEISDRLMGAS